MGHFEPFGHLEQTPKSSKSLGWIQGSGFYRSLRILEGLGFCLGFGFLGWVFGFLAHSTLHPVADPVEIPFPSPTSSPYRSVFK